MIRIYKYFFEPTNVTPDFTEVGASRRTRNGTHYTQYINEYHSFEIEFDDLTPTKLGHLFFINELCKPRDGSEGQNVDFVNENGEKYEVTIPINGLKYDELEGEKERYEATLTLEEVV